MTSMKIVPMTRAVVCGLAMTLGVAVANAKPKTAAPAVTLNAEGTKLQAEYEIEAPAAGKYLFSARVSTVQDGQKFTVSANGGSSMESGVPYTLGMWQPTVPIELTLVQGKNTIQYELLAGSKGVTIKDFTLTPAN